MSARRQSEYQRGYEAALRKVWREFIQCTAAQSDPVKQAWTFKAWRSWVIPARWPARKREGK